MNLPLGIWVLCAAFLLDHGSIRNALAIATTGAAIAGLAAVPGRVRHRIAGGWTALWRRAPAPSGQTS